ncbi:type VI secretion system baseplate subunit TssG [Paraburkholderia sp. BCC1876]|uniref:type VI secretion system baseplate subunit TssG n=1 Tax=Paraburkholderia sp. BCC1876 TaxID=2676303 RepID=UPI00159020F5|nr:type VI secretion system baseplate subunit TssG [Paraburkholderia sp. BCC1876]
MASASRPPAGSVEELLFDRPERIDVFQLVRLLRVRDSSRPSVKQRLKVLLTWRLMSGEADTRSFAGFARRLRFTADLSPAFPGVEVTGCRRLDAADLLDTPGGRAAMRHLPDGAMHALLNEPVNAAVNAPLAATLGAALTTALTSVENGEVVEICTPNYSVASELGPLPEPFLEWVRDRLRDDDRTFAAFLDVFNHRINVLRHQLKATQDVALDYALPQDTLQADFLASIAGMASLDAEAQIVLPRRAWLGMTATLADPRRSATAALTALRQYLGMPDTQLEQLVGDWRPLSSAQWSGLGKQGTLGSDAVLGTQVWNQMAGVRLTVPAVDYERLCNLLPPPWQPETPHDPFNQTAPTHPHHHQSAAEAAADNDAPLNGYTGLADMVRLLFDRRVDCTVDLSIAAANLPESLLSATPGSGVTAPAIPLVTAALPPGVRYRGLRLGQTAWLAVRSEANGDAGTDATSDSNSDLRTVSYAIAGDPQGPLQ